MKTLITKRLILRALRMTDVDAFNAYCQKPGIGPMAGWKPHESMEESIKILQMMIKENEVWGITLKPDDAIIGTIGLHVRTVENALANIKEIGYVLDDVHWGKGLMVEAVGRVLDYAFTDLELEAVTCGHADHNLQSKRVIEKTGFASTHTETRPHYDRTDITIQMYTITRHQYLGGRP